MQDTATCGGMSNVCVDRIKMIFPGVGQCDRCSSKNSQINMNCMDRSGLGNELMVEFTANRESDFTGFEMLVNCVEPGFDQNNIPPPDNRRKRQVQEECASPMGIGPRPFPELPPPVSQTEFTIIIYYNYDTYFVYRLPESSVFWIGTIHHCTLF